MSDLIITLEVDCGDQHYMATAENFEIAEMKLDQIKRKLEADNKQNELLTAEDN